VNKSRCHFIISAKENMFYWAFVCLFVCLSFCLSVRQDNAKKVMTNFNEFFFGGVRCVTSEN